MAPRAALQIHQELGQITPLTPDGLEVLWNPVKKWVKPWESEAPAEPPKAGPRCER